MDFKNETYIVFDLPMNVSDKIKNIRKSHDDFRASLPVEITVTGSSGCEVVASSQDGKEFIDQVKKVAKQLSPIDKDEVDKLMNYKIKGKHLIKSISVYQMGELPLRKLFSINIY